jgi:stage II sporulation protein P
MKRETGRHRRFRSYTLNMSSQKARTTIITLGLATAVFCVILSVIAVQLIAGDGRKGLSGRILHSISSSSLSRVMSQEIPMYASLGPTPTLAETSVTPKGFTNMLLYLFTDIDASNPLTMLGYQLPGMAVGDYQLLTPNPEYDKPPADHNHSPDNPPNANPEPREHVEPLKPSNEPLVYVYHSHNRESFLPELPNVTNADLAYHPQKNIEQAGRWIIDELKKNGVPGIQTLEDYWVKGSFNDAYDLSRPMVQKVLKEHKSLKLVFDIHRDSLEREVTTKRINGVDYARVYWIVGGGNPRSDKNQEQAIKLNEYLEKMYPGISRGVWKKPVASYDTRYNQDLHPNMVLIEIGGPYNSLEEVKRTSELLGKVIAAYLKDLQALPPNNIPLQGGGNPAPAAQTDGKQEQKTEPKLEKKAQ